MKCWLLRIFVLLLLGAIVNVAVATYIALYTQPRARVTYDPPPPSAWSAIDAQRPVVSLSEHEMRWLADRGYLSWQSGTRFRDQLFGLGRKDTRYARTMTEFWEGASIQRVDCGWPTLAFTGSMNQLYVSGSPIARMANFDAYAPLWPGFAINTGFYAFVLWLLFAGPFVLRRLRGGRRIRRGLCPKCAYDLRGTPKDATACPECGTAVARMERICDH